MSAVPGLRLQFGDQVQIVGAPADLDKAAAVVGNSLKELNETHFIPFFIGIVLGVALGTLPITVPGLPQPIKLESPYSTHCLRTNIPLKQGKDGNRMFRFNKVFSSFASQGTNL
jgi:hypothetical protein